MTCGGDFHEYKLIKLLLQNAKTIMLTASTGGFKRNWWSDKHEYHLKSCYCTPQRTASCIRWCDKMWGEAQNSEAWKPRSLKSGGKLATSSLLLIARATGERCKLPSGVEFAGLKTKKKFVTPWIAFLWGKLAAFWTTFLQHFAEVRMRTANKDKDNSKLNQYLF